MTQGPTAEPHVSDDLQRARLLSEERFRGVLESAPEAIVIVNRDGQIVLVNAQTERIFGYPRDELLGQPVEMLAPQRFRAALPGRRARFFNSPSTRAMGAGLELYARRKDGSEFPVEVSLSPLQTEFGVLAVSEIRDITPQKTREGQMRVEHRELVDATAFMNELLESSTGFSFIAMDLDGRAQVWNEGARRNYGYAAEELIGRHVATELHTPEDVRSGRVEEFLFTAYRTGNAEGVFERVRKDGSRFTASVAVTVRRDAGGAPVGYVLISKDITAQRLLEEQLQRMNEELEQQNRRVQEATRLKSEFLANMSHELRTPLTSIIGFAEMMENERLGPLQEGYKEFMTHILGSSQHLLQLINDVLDLARVEAGRIELRPEPMALDLILAEVRYGLAAMAAGKRIEVTSEVADGLGGLVGDLGKLRQVLYNYLSNAIKFTPDQGKVIVRALAEGDECFRIEVEDSGVGIRAEDLGRLFTEFEQLNASTARKLQGTGLGLALTRRLVEAQGGHVGVVSTYGSGSTFFAVLPRHLSVPISAQPVWPEFLRACEAVPEAEL